MNLNTIQPICNTEYELINPTDILNNFFQLLIDFFRCDLDKRSIIYKYLVLSDPFFDKELFNGFSEINFYITKDLTKLYDESHKFNFIDELNFNMDDFNKVSSLNEEQLRLKTYNLASEYSSFYEKDISLEEYLEFYKIQSKELYSQKKSNFKDNTKKLTQFLLYDIKMDTCFRYWMPKNCTKHHLKHFFWFYIRISIVLYLLKTTINHTLLQKYLKQIFYDLIPVMILIEKFYFDKQKIIEILRSYKFTLQGEFMFSNTKSIFKKDSIYEIKETKFYIPYEETEFEKIYKSKRRLSTILCPDFGFKPIKDDDIRNYRITQSIFYVLMKNKQIKEIYSVIPMLSYITHNNFPNDTQISEKLNETIMLYPKYVKGPDFRFLMTDGRFISSLDRQDSEFTELSENELEDFKNDEIVAIEIYALFVSKYLNIKCTKKDDELEQILYKFFCLNSPFRKLVENCVLCSILGLYDWCKPKKNIDHDFIKKLIDFYTNFVLNPNFKLKIKYIKMEHIKHIITENILYILKRNPQILNMMKNRKSSSNRLHMNSFEANVIYNANCVRNAFFDKKVVLFRKIKKRKKKKPFFIQVQDQLKIIEKNEYYINVIFNQCLPVTFEFIYSIEKMSDIDSMWKTKINAYFVDPDKKMCFTYDYIQWIHCAKYLIANFKFERKDKKYIKKLFRNFNLKTNPSILKILEKFSIYARSVIYYLFWFYRNKTMVVTTVPLPKKCYVYNKLIELFSGETFLDLAFSRCCSEIYNSIDNFGYQEISMSLVQDRIEYECIKKKHRNSKRIESEKYEFIRKKSLKYIKNIIMILFNNDIESFTYYKNRLLGEKSSKEVFLKEDATKRQKLFDLFSERQKIEVKSRNTVISEEAPNFVWRKFKSKRRCRERFLDNINIMNKFCVFLKKMCKWCIIWKTKELSVHSKDKGIDFLPANRHMFVEKIVYIEKPVSYTIYRSCTICKKVMVLCEESQFELYNYCCEDCWKEDDEFIPITIISTKKKKNICQISSVSRV